MHHVPVLAAVCTLWACWSVAAAQAPRPHIIFILADDLGYGDLSSYGATDLRTPHIDRLAHEGLRFTAHYAAANTCSPSRASLLTGRYPPRTRVNAVLADDTVEGLPLGLLLDSGVLPTMNRTQAFDIKRLFPKMPHRP